MGAPHEAALARTGLAQADRAAGAETDARLELDPAPWPARTRQVDDGQREPNVFRLEDGDYWSISFEDHTVTLRDLKGLHYLARLLAHPGREFHVLDLVSSGVAPSATPPGRTDPGVTTSGWGDSGLLLDAQARNAYRRRLEEIDEDLEDARLMSDSGRVAQAEAERDFLIRELSRAVGLSGRERRAGSASERARVSVTRAVRHAISRIRRAQPGPRRTPRPGHPDRDLLRLPAGLADHRILDDLTTRPVQVLPIAIWARLLPTVGLSRVTSLVWASTLTEAPGGRR